MRGGTGTTVYRSRVGADHFTSPIIHELNAQSGIDAQRGSVVNTQYARRLLTAALSIGLLAAGAAQAAKAPKVDICHFDAEEGIFKPISLNGNAVANHVENHGDQFPNIDPPEGGIELDEYCSYGTAEYGRSEISIVI
jgi:hypothetical protein